MHKARESSCPNSTFPLLKITEQSRSKTIGSLAADPTVLGFSATGPIFLNDDPSNRGVQEFREYFYICTLLGTLIFPMDKPAWLVNLSWLYCCQHRCSNMWRLLTLG